MIIRNRKKFFYGWVIVGVCSLLMFLNAGCAFYAFGIFLKPIAADIGCTRGEVSIALSCSRCCYIQVWSQKVNNI